MNVDFSRSIGALKLLAEIGCYTPSAPGPAPQAKHGVRAAGWTRNRLRRAMNPIDELPDAC